MDCRSLLQKIPLTQGSNPGVLHCRQIPYHLSYRDHQDVQDRYKPTSIGLRRKNDRTPEVEAQEEETLDTVLQGLVKPKWGGRRQSQMGVGA